jgi:hypothetical protein
MNIDLSVKDLLDSYFASDSGKMDSGPLTDLLSEAGVKALIGNSSISVSMIADKINTMFGLSLPVFLPIPKEILFPYSTSVSLYAGLPEPSQKAITVDVTSVKIIRTSNAIIMNTSVTIIPINTEEAANSLAASLNPVLGANSIPSSVGLKDFAFISQEKHSFKWCVDLFGAQILKFAVPAICKECLLDSFPGQVVSTIPVTSLVKINSMDVSQLSSQAGFGAKGIVEVKYPSQYPAISIDIGYFNLGTTIESSDLVSLQLPNGIKFFPKSDGTAIDARMIISKDAQIPSKVQSLADVLINDQDAGSSYAGINKFAFGLSASSQIVTFSKLNIDMNTKTIKSLLSSQSSKSSSLLSSFITPNMIKLESADFSLDSSTKAALTITSTVKLPIPNLSFSMGSLSLTSLINDNQLVSLSISPLSLAGNNAPLKLSVGMNIATGANGNSENMARLASGFINSDSALDILLGVTGLTITPQGDGGAVIDQFARVKVSAKSGKLIQTLKSSGSSSPSALDLSAVLPGNDLLTKLNPDIKFVLFHALTGGAINSGADLAYSNMLPLSAKVPYFSITFLLSGEEVVNIEVIGIELVRQSGIKVILTYRNNETKD